MESNSNIHSGLPLPKRLVILLLVCLFAINAFTINANAQSVTDNIFGKGIRIIAKDSSFSMKFSTRMQNRLEASYVESGNQSYTDKFYLRRARLKFDGFIDSPKLVYKIELDVVNAEVLDAVVKWNFAGNFNIWFGQTKLPGNRERVISSQKLQFVDRSLLNSKFNIDRDKGIQLRHSFKINNIIVREVAAVSIGEGKNFKKSSAGHNFTGRLELLPFGKFKSKGDYFASDLKREAKPKLAMGVTYDFNNKAVKSGGQLGSEMSEMRNLSTVFADMMFKYKGWSIMAEYADKRVPNVSPAVFDSAGVFLESFYTGSSVNAQMGYLFNSNWELSGRYTIVTPEKATRNNKLEQYTLGISKYVVGHSLKVQSDCSLLHESSKADQILYRLQVEMSF